jgi:four helix bundle protein
MKEGNIVREKSYSFSLKIIKTYQELTQEKREFILSKQLVRSGTSIGANIEEATGAQSKNDFISKLSISYKEAWETLYWLKLLTDSNLLDKKKSDLLIYDCEEILKILGAIIKTSKS